MKNVKNYLSKKVEELIVIDLSIKVFAYTLHRRSWAEDRTIVYR